MAEEDIEKDERKWVGVRLSKVMMHQIEMVVNTHPEYAWNGPNDFVRDAVRRHLEYIRRQDMLREGRIESLQPKVEQIIEESLGVEERTRFERELRAIEREIDVAKEPQAFVDALTKLLENTYGQSIAKTISKKLLDMLQTKGSV
ncbi:MAG: hypothetical protein N3F63_01050 [Thermoplasmata archaeon]|nr:hypothetical protein [Thermoplasmata archaeon]